MGRAGADHDAPDRPTTAGAGVAGALIDLEPLLHLAIAVGRRVVIDRAAATLDGFCEHEPNRPIEARLVRGLERRDRTQRVQPGQPQCLVGVDVADTGEERLVEQERLEPSLPPADESPERAQREAVVQWFGAGAREQTCVALLDNEMPAGDVSIQADPAELADVAE